jgi:hypothetical protein
VGGEDALTLETEGEATPLPIRTFNGSPVLTPIVFWWQLACECTQSAAISSMSPLISYWLYLLFRHMGKIFAHAASIR